MIWTVVHRTVVCWTVGYFRQQCVKHNPSYGSVSEIIGSYKGMLDDIVLGSIVSNIIVLDRSVTDIGVSDRSG